MYLKETTQAVTTAGIPWDMQMVIGWVALCAKLLSFDRIGRSMLAGVACTLVFGLLETQAAAPAAKEYEVKAAFLFNFAQYVEWPPEMFAAPTAPIIIGVLGDDLFGNVLDQTVRGETVRNRPIAIHRSRQIENLKHCHLLFISKSERGRLAHVFTKLAGTHCLTVGETERFAHNGGIINFRLQGANVRFEINLNAARRSGLTISSKLLRLAIIIGSAQAKEGT
ncbi:MAG: YfiR family protein [Verrucomicrobia bacterium]|nr:YfiR family protein [Verrucomicrobiota bacterium]